MNIKKLEKLPISDTGCSNIRVNANSGELLIEYGYRSIEDKSKKVGKILFDNIIAYSFRNAMHSRAYESESYNSLVEIEKSDWIKWLLEIEAPMTANSASDKKHYVLFFTDNGYLEVVADSYNILPIEARVINYDDIHEYIE